MIYKLLLWELSWFASIRLSFVCLCSTAASLLISCQKPIKKNDANHSHAIPFETTHPTFTTPGADPEVNKAIAIVRSAANTNDDHWAQVNAVNTLGKARANEAVPLLIEKLTKIATPDSDNIIDFIGTFPCITALANIGEPAVPSLRMQFETGSSEEELPLLLTLTKIKGKRWVLSYLDTLQNSKKSQKSHSDVSELRGWVSSLSDKL